MSRHRSGREVTRRSCSAPNLASSPRVPEVAARSAATESSSDTEAAARAAEASSRELGRHRGAAAAASGLVILRGGTFFNWKLSVNSEADKCLPLESKV